ncbi:hypothetical protein RHRU231_40077 [Rhodococcus ruber]|uniref:Uncharacterized protein n=1 Tax=Rhodococcus ruber TaxID=1830 RepID=A0A098BJD5_9NOCA|nr:hypothetical protein RHRU231_40077 [Rhodococcus ruber]
MVHDRRDGADDERGEGDFGRDRQRSAGDPRLRAAEHDRARVPRHLDARHRPRRRHHRRLDLPPLQVRAGDSAGHHDPGAARCDRHDPGALLRPGGSPDAQLQALVRAWVMFHTARQLDALVGATELRSLNEAGRRLAVADLDPGAPAGHLRGRLAEYRPPHRIVVSGDMPRTPAGTLVPRVARRARTARRRASAPSCGRGAPAGAPRVPVPFWSTWECPSGAAGSGHR